METMILITTNDGTQYLCEPAEAYQSKGQGYMRADKTGPYYFSFTTTPEQLTEEINQQQERAARWRAINEKFQAAQPQDFNESQHPAEHWTIIRTLPNVPGWHQYRHKAASKWQGPYPWPDNLPAMPPELPAVSWSEPHTSAYLER